MGGILAYVSWRSQSYDCSAEGAAPHPQYFVRGYGAVGSAFDWQSKGQGSESPYLHQQHRFYGGAFVLYKVLLDSANLQVVVQ